MDDPRRVAITGVTVASALGRGLAAVHRRALEGEPAFAPITRFDARRYRVGAAAELPDAAGLVDELAAAVEAACGQAGLDRARRASCPLLLAGHGDAGRLPLRDETAEPGAAGAPSTAGAPDEPWTPAGVGRAVAERAGLPADVRCYTSACVAASTAIADAAALIRLGRVDRAVVAAGYLVDEEYHALFDAGRALAADEAVRPFSAGRRGLLLGDGIGAIVLESAQAAARAGTEVLGWLLGWGRAGDAHHVCQPDPRGTGLARAVSGALERAGLDPSAVGYVNAHGTGTAHNDPAEAAALHRALGDHAAKVPVSSTKSLHGHALEAAGLLELAIALQSARTGWLPVSAGYLGPDEECPLNLVLDEPLRAESSYALSTNSAFGGANAALLVGAP